MGGCVLTYMCMTVCACTFDPLSRAVSAELLSESRVVQLQLLQTLRQTQDRGPQGLLVPLGALRLCPTATGAQRRNKSYLLFLLNTLPCLSKGLEMGEFSTFSLQR